MKVTNLMMVNIMNKLEVFSTKKLPQRISYAITKNLMIISKEYQCYEIELNKLFDSYSEHIVKDTKNKWIRTKEGIPIVNDDVAEKFREELAELFNIEIKLNFYFIPMDVFNYDDSIGKYDALSARNIFELQSILCKEGDSDEISI